ncbi:dTDP-4-dehydrorhamnose 3,5-epimerase [Synechocystis sp. LKSZ1]|uniref:dTDP-4-dehydrorhamnose 3,5-epimerase n=1 Tax=Synechocystis sp. LKSZ1 TaxID=3144951 RepID=UPI00336BB1C0
MHVIPTKIPDAVILEPKVYEDERGFFLESYNEKTLAKSLGFAPHFVQDNHSHSRQGVLRGLHYQITSPQGKLVRVVTGEVLDVAVDLRRSSPTFGQWASCVLSAENKRQFWIPEGFAHGFLVLSPSADFLYKTTNYYCAEAERTIRWDDPDLAIDWQCPVPPILSQKDQQGQWFKSAEVFV